MKRRIVIGLALALGWPALGSSEPKVPALDTSTPLATTLTSSSASGPHRLSRALPLTSKEQRAVKLANEWKGRRDNPVRGEDGSVIYLFGATLPCIVCSPLYVCDIRLEEGEIIHDIHAGDTVRWKITPAMSGSDSNATPHIVVKPTEAGLSTNLLITTDRRTYTIELTSTQSDWMPAVGFDYAGDTQTRWAAYVGAQRGRIDRVPSRLENLDFGFRLAGDSPPWRPLRVYTDGAKTYIQFPKTLQNGEAPALVALGQDAQEQLVNYRLVGDRYVVDRVLERAALVSGVGRNQVKVEITREGGGE